MNRSAFDPKVAAYVLFLLAVLLVGLGFPDFAETGIPIGASFVVTTAIILVGLWRGLARTGSTAATRLAVWLAVAVPLVLWIALAWGLALRGTFQANLAGIRDVPALPFAIFLPALVGSVLLARSRHVTAALDATPPSWLVGLQVYRVLGAIFLFDWARGTIPGAFALPAGIGDVAVGLLALPAALRVASNTPSGRKAGIYWNLLGLADFVGAISTGWLSSPGPLQLLARDHPNVRLGTFPIVLVPAFAVPFSIILHVLSIRQLRRSAERSADARAIGSNRLAAAPSAAS